MQTLRRTSLLLVLIASTLAGSACSGDATSSAPVTRNVSVAFRVAPGASSANQAAMSLQGAQDGLSIVSGDDAIVLSEAQLVLRNIKLQRAGASCGDDTDSDDSGNGCPTMFAGSILVDLPLTDAETQRLEVPLPEGTYSSVQLRLHKVTGASELENEFIAANPELEDASVRVVGTYNGAPFTFVTDLTAVVKVSLQEPLVVTEDSQDFTVTIDVRKWFVRSTGQLISPLEAMQQPQVRNAIEQNIRSAFHAFRDSNRNGSED